MHDNWKHDYLELVEAIDRFLADRLVEPYNRLTAILQGKLDLCRSLLILEVNGYDAEMERDNIDYLKKQEQKIEKKAMIFPETSDV